MDSLGIGGCCISSARELSASVHRVGMASQAPPAPSGVFYGQVSPSPNSRPLWSHHNVSFSPSRFQFLLSDLARQFQLNPHSFPSSRLFPASSAKHAHPPSQDRR